MAKVWDGDGVLRLPSGKVEPYRLWFEFLKLADRDPSITVDEVFYEDWGDFKNQRFNEWWSGATWRNLFAIQGGVSVINPTDTIQSNDPSTTLMVSIPIGKSIRDSLKDVKDLLEEYGATDKIGASPKGKYSLVDGYEKGFMKKLRKANMMVRLYGYWLDSADEDELNRYNVTASAYYDWAKERDSNIMEKGWKYSRPEFPFCFHYYVENYLRGGSFGLSEGMSQKQLLEHSKASDKDNSLRQIKRLISNARKLTANAAVGQFPKYT
jgi:hypothetical protein